MFVKKNFAKKSKLKCDLVFDPVPFQIFNSALGTTVY